MKSIWFWFGALVLLGGCGPIYYAPISMNVPMIRAQGEGTASIHFGDYRSLNFLGAYSPSPNFGLLLDGYKTRLADDSNSAGGGGSFFEGGAGYYRPVRKRFLWDAYGLLGFGGVENHLTTPANTVGANFVRYGVQPSVGFRSRYFDASIASRVVRLNYYDINGSSASEVQYLRSQGGQFLAEPSFTARLGYDFLKLQVQFGNSYNWTDSQFRQKRDFGTWGVVYTFTKR